MFFFSAFEPVHAAPDVTAHVELLGNPFATRYTTVSSARIAWRMRLFNDRIYIGHGDTTSGAGPADVWSFDLAQDAFVKDGVVFEEMIDQLRSINGRLYMNGRDSMGQGAMYRLDTTKGWQTFKIAEDGHYYDIYEFGGKIFSNVGVNTHPWPRLAISSDDGATFTIPAQTIDGKNFAATPTLNGWEFMEFNGNLYLGYNRSTSSDIVNNPPFILKYTGNDAAPLSRVHWLYSDFYGDGTIALPSNFTEVDENLGIFTGAGNLYSTVDIETPQSANRLVGEPAGLPVADNITFGTGCIAIRKYDGTFYLAYNFRSGGAYWIAVCESTTGTTWTEKFRFTTGTRAKSFERSSNGDFYFGGWGVLTGVGEVAAPGNIWRVRAGVIDASPTLVNVSADDLSVFEGAGDLTLRIRRTGTSASALTVNYTVSGTAVAGTDYSALSGTTSISAGQQSVTVPITVLNNPAVTGARTLTVTLSSDAAYTIATPGSITFTITDETAGASTIPLDGLALWFKADAGVTSGVGGAVSAWADQSGRGYSATQSTSTKRPILVASGPNGRPAINFDGVDDWLDIGAINSQAYYTAVVFANNTAITSASTQTLLDYMSYAQGGGSGLDFGSAQTIMTDEVVGFYFQAWTGSGNSIAAGTHRLAWRQPQHASAFGLTIDGVSKTVSAPSSTRIITPNGEAVKIGARNGTSRFYNGSISEIIIYNRPLSAAEATIVQNYLDQRYVAANQSPAAGADSVTRSPGAGIDIPAAALTANDSDPDGDSISITGVGSPMPIGATVTFDGSTIQYTPPANNNADGSFTYQLSDSAGATTTGTVTVNVSNTAPVATDDSFERQPLNDLVVTAASILANDSDADNDPLTISSVPATLPSGATVAIEGANVRYHPPSGSNAPDEFTYTVSDGRGLTATATVTVTVANNAPTPGSDFRNTSVGQPIAMTLASLLANDSDADGDAISFLNHDARSAAGGTIRLSTSTSQLIYIPPSGFSGSDSFQYTIQDARGLTAQASVNVAVNVSNQAPTPAADSFSRTLNKPITLLYTQLLSNDTDPDGDLPLKVVAAMGRTAAGAKVVLGATSLTYTAPPGFNSTDTFSYTVRDNRGAMASATVTIHVGVAAPRPVPEIGPDVKLTAQLTPTGKLSLRLLARPGTVLCVDSATSPNGDWSSLCQIRTGQDGIGYFEEEKIDSGRFFKASILTQ